MRGQRQIVFDIVKYNQPIRTEQVKIMAMRGGVSCADRYLRWLKEDGDIVAEKHPYNKTKTWRLADKHNVIVEKNGQLADAAMIGGAV